MTKLTIAGISFMMIAGLIAPGIQSTHASTILTPDDFCNAFSAGEFPNGIGTVSGESFLVKCFDALDACFTAGIPMKAGVTTQCTFLVLGGSALGDSVIINDLISAEWEVVNSSTVGTTVCAVTEANQRGQDQSNGNAKANRSATGIHCVGPPIEFFGILIEVGTRESPSGKFFKPTFCGTFELNSGAVMLQGDQFGDPVLEAGEPIVLAETGPLEVEAVGEDCDL